MLSTTPSIAIVFSLCLSDSPRVLTLISVRTWNEVQVGRVWGPCPGPQHCEDVALTSSEGLSLSSITFCQCSISALGSIAQALALTMILQSSIFSHCKRKSSLISTSYKWLLQPPELYCLALLQKSLHSAAKFNYFLFLFFSETLAFNPVGHLNFFLYFYTVFKGYFPFTAIKNIGYIPHVVQHILLRNNFKKFYWSRVDLQFVSISDVQQSESVIYIFFF